MSSVVAIATSIPTPPSQLPRRACFGDERKREREDEADDRDEVEEAEDVRIGDHASSSFFGSGRRLNISSMRSVTNQPPTTFAVASTIATKPTAFVKVSSAKPRMMIAPDDDDAVDEVRPRHQRGVQHRRHLRDHLEAEERGEHEDRQLDDEGQVGHAAASGRVTQAPLVISSSQSSDELAFRGEVQEERADVARVELARVEGHRRREVRVPIDGHASVLDDLAGHGDLAVPAGLGGEVDDDRARAHALDRARRDELRRRTAGNRGGRDHDVEVGNPLLERRLLLRLLLGRELARVAAGRLLGADAEVEERRAEALAPARRRPVARRMRRRPRRGAARSRSPAGRRRRRR